MSFNSRPPAGKGSKKGNTGRICTSSRVIAVASGKGGVGKTNIAVNLSLSLARRGLRVALLDADLGTANVDIVLGLQPRYHLQHVVTGQKSLDEIIIEAPFGLQVIPGASGLAEMVDLPEMQREALLRALLALDGKVDLLVIDTSPGVGRDVIRFILAAGEMLLITAPEPTAITDAYALIKVLSGYHIPVNTHLVVNNVRHFEEGEVTARQLTMVAKQFLNWEMDTAGMLPFDKSVIEAVRRQIPLAQRYPRCPVSLAIDAVGERLWNGISSDDLTTDVSRFFKQILSSKSVETV
jgi:flagellar biosynthesis protein FlhG